jgi:ligand-binding SRPBCC domain-containing protein
MAGSYELTISSELAAPANELWQHAVSPQGVNRELRPLVRMTFPSGVEDLAAASGVLAAAGMAGDATGEASVAGVASVTGRRLFRSWILLGGVLPVDYDDVTFVELEPGRRFLERSPMFSQRLWQHERTVEATATGCRVTDRVRFAPKLAVLGAVYAAIFRAAFRLRHRNLRRIWPESSAA